MEIQQNVPLAPLTTLGVGGPARYFAESRSAAEVADAVHFARSHDLPLFVLGGGSNLVVSDSGWPGLVLKMAIPGIHHRPVPDHHLFEVGAGEDWDRFVAAAIAQDCAGIECLSGIPGSVGGTPVQNVGAYGQEVSNCIASVLVFDLKAQPHGDAQREILNQDCGFAYRTSRFNTTERGRYIILQVNYALKPHGHAHIEYADLKKHFAGWEIAPTLAQVRDAVRHIRASKSMLITPGDPDSRSAGSFFKNPVLKPAQFEALHERAVARNLQIPSYAAASTGNPAPRKISAAWLVEHSGFAKGFSEGEVGISRKHALAIVNRGHATAAAILKFKEDIQERVQQIWGVHLEPEPVFVGFPETKHA